LRNRIIANTLSSPNPRLPAERHLSRFLARSALVEPKRLLTPLPVLERASSVLERRGRKHRLHDDEIRIGVTAHLDHEV